MMQISIKALPATANRRIALSDWILATLPSNAEVLEVGAGQGKWDYPKLISKSALRLVGVDPDLGICDNPYLHERYQMTLETFAQRETGQFDAIYSHMVVEHVEDPLTFASAIYSMLKPGGAFFGVTPNLAHYFGMVSYLAGRFGIQAQLLRQLRGDLTADSYHFKAGYRMNTTWTLKKLFRRVGMERLDFRMLESPSDFACYFPKLLRFLAYWHSTLMYTFRLYPLMGTILFCAVKPINPIDPLIPKPGKC